MKSAIYLRKRIIWLLAIKLVALVVIQHFFFGSSHRVKIDDQRVEARFFTAATEPDSGE